LCWFLALLSCPPPSPSKLSNSYASANSAFLRGYSVLFSELFRLCRQQRLSATNSGHRSLQQKIPFPGASRPIDIGDLTRPPTKAAPAQETINRGRPVLRDLEEQRVSAVRSRLAQAGRVARQLRARKVPRTSDVNVLEAERIRPGGFSQASARIDPIQK
jgi:hypothetical protein